MFSVPWLVSKGSMAVFVCLCQCHWQVLFSCGLDVNLDILMLCLAPLFILCAMIRDLKTLAIFSGIANVLQVICIIIIIVNIGLRGFPDWKQLNMVPKKATDIALFFGLSMFSLEGIGVVCLTGVDLSVGLKKFIIHCLGTSDPNYVPSPY